MELMLVWRKGVKLKRTTEGEEKGSCFCGREGWKVEVETHEG